MNLKFLTALTVVGVLSISLVIQAQPISPSVYFQSIAELPPGASQEIMNSASMNDFTKLDFRTLPLGQVRTLLPPLAKAITNDNRWVRGLAINVYRELSLRVNDANLLFDDKLVSSFADRWSVEPDEQLASLLVDMTDKLAMFSKAPELPILLKRYISNGNERPMVQAIAVHCLAKHYANDFDTPMLITRFWSAHDDSDVRIQVLKGLGLANVSDPKFVPLFAQGLASPDKRVRREAIQYVHHFQSEPLIRAELFRISNDVNDTPENRDWALRSLQGRSGEAKPIMKQ